MRAERADSGSRTDPPAPRTPFPRVCAVLPDLTVAENVAICRQWINPAPAKETKNTKGGDPSYLGRSVPVSSPRGSLERTLSQRLTLLLALGIQDPDGPNIRRRQKRGRRRSERRPDRVGTRRGRSRDGVGRRRRFRRVSARFPSLRLCSSSFWPPFPSGSPVLLFCCCHLSRSSSFPSVLASVPSCIIPFSLSCACKYFCTFWRLLVDAIRRDERIR